MDNCLSMPPDGLHIPVSHRQVKSVPYEYFTAAIECACAQSVTRINGLIILQYPRGMMICNASNEVTIISQIGSNMMGYLDEALTALDVAETQAA